MEYGICKQKQKKWEDDHNFALLYIIFDIQPWYILEGLSNEKKEISSTVPKICDIVM